jgi:O-antigen/teichoic acid export membrane protein
MVAASPAQDVNLGHRLAGQPASPAPTGIADRDRPAARKPFAALALRLDLVLTFGIEFLILAASFVVLRLAAHRWGPAGFGEYVLARRSLGWIQLPVLCGLHLALARYIAMARAAEDRTREAAYLRGGLLIVAGSLGLMSACLLAVPGELAFLLLGDSGSAATIRVLVLPIGGMVLHTATYGALRGRQMVRAANALQAFSLGVLPLSAILVPRVTVRGFLALVGSSWILASVLAMIAIYLASPKVSVDRPTLRARVGDLFRYGFPRVPGEVALGALFTLPVTFAAHLAGSVEAGRIGLGLSVLQLVGALFAPLGQVLLPVVSTQLAKGEIAALKNSVTRTATLGVLVAVAAVGGLEWLTPWLLRDFFGSAFEPAVPVVRIIALGGVPYAVYILLRSVLDAIHHEPMNARNLVYGVVAFVAVAVLVDSATAVSFAVVAGMSLLGGRTLFDVHRSVYRRAALAAPANTGFPAASGSA